MQLKEEDVMQPGSIRKTLEGDAGAVPKAA